MILNMLDFNLLAQQYMDELAHHVIPFWISHSKDSKYGGYFSCLSTDGSVYDTDKFIWLQARQVWTFSMLYQKFEQNQEWLDFALHGADFLIKHGRAANGHWYFSLNRQGQPLVQPYNIFSDCFACMALGQLFQATGDEKYGDIARNTFYNILERKGNAKGIYEKSIPSTRPLKNFALPMILSNLVLEIESLLPPGLVEETIQQCIREVVDVFYNEEFQLLMENVTPDGQFNDSFDGRLVNPGHAIEATWFLIDLSERMKDQELAKTAVKIMLRMIEFGWDKVYGGIYYFMDVKGHPPQQLEWDQKLWWVHLESLVALLKGFQATGETACLEWFEKIHQYTWSRFPDHQHGEWFGYLNRRGEVSLDLKGGKWKGCFHVPRALLLCNRILEKL